jgi:hypothetical protein
MSAEHGESVARETTAQAVAKVVSEIAGYALQESWEAGNDLTIFLGNGQSIIHPGKGKEKLPNQSVSKISE